MKSPHLTVLLIFLTLPAFAKVSTYSRKSFMRYKSKLLFFVVLFMVLPYICFSYYEEIYISSNGNKLKLVNTLPETFPKIGKVEDLGKLLEKIDEKNGLPNAELWIELRGSNLLFLFETREKHFFEDLYSSGSLYLLPCYNYLKNINVWFFDDIQFLNKDRPSIMEDFRAFNIQYWFTLMKGDNHIQVEGKVGPIYSSLYGQTIADMILYEPLFIKYNDKEFKAHSDIYFRERYFYEFKLSSPYNSITREYYPSYFVYLFFDDKKKIEGIPEFFN